MPLRIVSTFGYVPQKRNAQDAIDASASIPFNLDATA